MDKPILSPAVSTNSIDNFEQQNMSDSSSTGSLSRATKNWRRIKEISEKGEKRPPWKVVSLSTLPKADTNAILKARLLDASRRIRAGKVQVGVQTDVIPTKLLKEVNTEAQVDLIQTRDAGNLTDGTITLKQNGPIILTYSVAQMTDEKQVEDAETQTVVPSVSGNFFEQYFEELPSFCNTNRSSNSNDLKTTNFTENEFKLLSQIKEIRKLDQELAKRRPIKEQSKKHDDSPERSSSVQSDDSLSVPNEKTIKRNSLKDSTVSSWNFDLDYYEKIKSPKDIYHYMQRNSLPKNDIKLRKKLDDSKLTRNMLLYPLAERKFSPRYHSLPRHKSMSALSTISWSDDQLSDIYILLNTTQSLIDIFKQMSFDFGPDIKLHDVPERDSNSSVNDIQQFPSDYWYPIIQNSSQILNEKLASWKKFTPKSVKPLSADYIASVTN